MIKIGIVDDHAIVRSGLKQFFSDQVDLRVVGEAASGREAIDLVRNVELDILVEHVLVYCTACTVLVKGNSADHDLDRRSCCTEKQYRSMIELKEEQTELVHFDAQ